MMSLPDPQTQVWSNLHVGGSTDDPVILKLIEENLMILDLL